MLRDCLVVEIQDRLLSQWMQLNADLMTVTNRVGIKSMQSQVKLLGLDTYMKLLSIPMWESASKWANIYRYQNTLYSGKYHHCVGSLHYSNFIVPERESNLLLFKFIILNKLIYIEYQYTYTRQNYKNNSTSLTMVIHASFTWHHTDVHSGSSCELSGPTMLLRNVGYTPRWRCIWEFKHWGRSPRSLNPIYTDSEVYNRFKPWSLTYLEADILCWAVKQLGLPQNSPIAR